MESYVDHRDGSLYVTGSRVSLASVVHGFLAGASPETIQHNFPALTLEQVYGAIAYYLGHKDEVELDLHSRESAWQDLIAGAVPVREDLLRRKREQELATERNA